MSIARRGLAMLVGVGVIVSICFYSNSNIVANTVSHRAIETNNYTSQSKIDKSLIHYASERECFKQTAENLSKNYLTKGGKYYHGKTLYKVNLEYCEPGVKKEKGKKKVYKYMWADDVYGCMKMIIG